MRKWSFSFFIISFLILLPMGQADLFEEGPYLEDIPEPSLEALESNFFVLDGENSLANGLGELPSLMPVHGIITSGFGWRAYRRRLGRSRQLGRMHKGIDIAAPRGTPIVASAPGRVYFVGRKNGYGNTVIVDHGNAVHTLYAHNSKIFVEEGDQVARGEKIAAVGSTGRSTGPHVHYEVRVEGVPRN
ncbi:MAG: M23 family metallopeptidase, partial [Deltaproteobacteria bacterium]|nr:M23 family metallopeptidase [Deltaproteobacteria bacterium]